MVSLMEVRSFSRAQPSDHQVVLENNPDYARFVYLSYSRVNEKWNVIHAIERLVFFLQAHHFRTGIQITYPNSPSRENDP